jgi:hypothetical protein
MKSILIVLFYGLFAICIWMISTVFDLDWIVNDDLSYTLLTKILTIGVIVIGAISITMAVLE